MARAKGGGERTKRETTAPPLPRKDVPDYYYARKMSAIFSICRHCVLLCPFYWFWIWIHDGMVADPDRHHRRVVDFPTVWRSNSANALDDVHSAPGYGAALGEKALGDS